MMEKENKAPEETGEDKAGVPAVVEDTRGEVGPPTERHYDRFRNALVGRREEFAAALVGWMDPDHFVEVLTTAYLGNEKLWNANPVSLYSACRRAALLNLRPDGDEGYLEVWWDKDALAANGGKGEFQVSFNPMYKGLIRTLTRGGTVLMVDAQVVRSGDEFDFQMGDEPFVRHRPEKDPNKRGDIIYAYVIFHLANGLKYREVMSIEEMDQIRENAKRRRTEGPAWRTNPDQMYRKMPIRRGTKYLDLNPKQAAVFRYDAELETGRAREPVDDIPEAEYRTLDERSEAAAQNTVNDLHEGIERAKAREISEKEVGFGAHREKTWGELFEKLPGYVTHYVLTDDCPWVEEDVKDALRAWLGIDPNEDNGEKEAPDPAEIDILVARGLEAIETIYAEAGPEDEECVRVSEGVQLLAHEENLFALVDLVDELERKVTEAGQEEG